MRITLTSAAAVFAAALGALIPAHAASPGTATCFNRGLDATSARAWQPVGEGDGDGCHRHHPAHRHRRLDADASPVGDGAWRDLLARNHARMRDLLNAHLGREITTTDDGLLAVFDRPVRAVNCAKAMVAASRAMRAADPGGHPDG